MINLITKLLIESKKANVIERNKKTIVSEYQLRVKKTMAWQSKE